MRRIPAFPILVAFLFSTTVVFADPLAGSAISAVSIAAPTHQKFPMVNEKAGIRFQNGRLAYQVPNGPIREISGGEFQAKYNFFMAYDFGDTVDFDLFAAIWGSGGRAPVAVQDLERKWQERMRDLEHDDNDIGLRAFVDSGNFDLGVKYALRGLYAISQVKFVTELKSASVRVVGYTDAAVSFDKTYPAVYSANDLMTIAAFNPNKLKVNAVAVYLESKDNNPETLYGAAFEVAAATPVPQPTPPQPVPTPPALEEVYIPTYFLYTAKDYTKGTACAGSTKALCFAIGGGPYHSLCHPHRPKDGKTAYIVMGEDSADFCPRGELNNCKDLCENKGGSFCSCISADSFDCFNTFADIADDFKDVKEAATRYRATPVYAKCQDLYKSNEAKALAPAGYAPVKLPK